MIEASQFSLTIFERETRVQIGKGLTCTKCSCEVVFSVQSLQKTSLAAETTGGEILVAFWRKHDLRSNLKVSNSNLQNFPRGACSHPPSFVNSYALLVCHHSGCTTLKQLALDNQLSVLISGKEQHIVGQKCKLTKVAYLQPFRQVPLYKEMLLQKLIAKFIERCSTFRLHAHQVVQHIENHHSN